MFHRRFILTPYNEQDLPLYVESIGHNPEQEKVGRSNGYPYYHWLQTLKGEGTMMMGDQMIRMPENSGVLILPHQEHYYEADGAHWESLYLTFGGPIVPQLLTTLGFNTSTYYQWEDGTPLTTLLLKTLETIHNDSDIFGINTSTYVYHFLITLKKYGQLQRNTTIHQNIKKLQPLIDWMEEHMGDPNIGLNHLASILDVSSRYLNTLFRETFDLSPYAYFLNLRVRRAKDLLIRNKKATIKTIANEVGFRDSSHFIATFRKSVGVTPEQFRHLY